MKELIINEEQPSKRIKKVLPFILSLKTGYYYFSHLHRRHNYERGI